MEKVSQEKEFFEKTFKTVNKLLAISGLQLDNNDINRTVFQRLRCRLRFTFNCVFYILAIILEIAWVIGSILTHRKVVEITYFMPCLTLSLLGAMKSFSFMSCAHHVNDLPISLRKLQAISYARRTYRDEVEKDLLKQSMPMLNITIYSLLIITSCGLLAFSIGPFIITGFIYHETGRVQLGLPFFAWYPFDPFNMKIWPITYIHQIYSGIFAVYTVLGPDDFFALSCTFIHVQFKCLQYDIERIHVRSCKSDIKEIEGFTSELKEIIERHKELIRCVELLEKIFTKSTLFNVATSSFIICAAGFNVTWYETTPQKFTCYSTCYVVNTFLMKITKTYTLLVLIQSAKIWWKINKTIDDYILMPPFIAFLSMGLIQIYLFCYYGDIIMKTSMAVSTAVYNSDWYRADAKVGRDLLLISTRSRRPCRLTAYNFADINMNTFCRIMGTAWSYFTLLKTTYK